MPHHTHHSSIVSSFVVLLAFFGFSHSLFARTLIPKKPTRKEFAAPSETVKRSASVTPVKTEEKEWNFYIYIAGENNLAWFVDVNCEQMARIGSNKNVNILCSVDRFAGGPLYRSEIHKADLKKGDNGIRQVWRTADQPAEDQALNPTKYYSGTGESLYSFLEWAIKTYPARRHCLVLWGHGSGILEPAGWGRIMSEFHSSSFYTHPVTGEVFITRGKKEAPTETPRKGIAFNDSRGVFVDNQTLSSTLDRVRKEVWGSKKGLEDGKFDVIGMDACCMAGIEVAAQLRKHTDHLVFSQEVELGPGWNYEPLMKETTQNKTSPLDLCFNIVSGYEKEYLGITSEYTMSTVDFTHKQPDGTQTFALLESKIKELAITLIDVLENSENGKAVRQKIMRIRNSPDLSTSFYGDQYVDLRRLLRSLSTVIQSTLVAPLDRPNRNAVIRLTQEATSLLNQAVPYFTSGSMYGSSPNLEKQKNKTVKSDVSRARGLSIYFPTRRIHNSYEESVFAKTTNWRSFLQAALRRW